MLSITPDQLSAAGSYIARTWGDHGYRITDIRQPTRSVAVFHVAYLDGSRFAVAADKWGNCRELPDEMAARIDVVREMHGKANAA